jgi:hypothetical protein
VVFHDSREKLFSALAGEISPPQLLTVRGVRRDQSGRSTAGNCDPASGNVISVGNWKNAACGLFRVEVRADRLIRAFSICSDPVSRHGPRAKADNAD